MNQHESKSEHFRQLLDFGRTAHDYAEHRKGFPNGFYERLFAGGYIVPGMNMVDLGTGTGTVARGLHRRGINVVGLDPAEELLAEARKIDAGSGMMIDYRVGIAEDMPFGDESVDAVIAGQCWHWVDSFKALQQIKRVLKPNGRLIICHFDWLPIERNIVRRTEELMEDINPEWTYGSGVGMYPQWLVDLQASHYESIETFSFDVVEHYSQLAWRGRIRASAAIGGTLSHTLVEQFDRKLAEMLKDVAGDADLTIPHRVWAVTAVRPSA